MKRQNNKHRSKDSCVAFYLTDGLPPADVVQNTLLIYLITREEIEACDTSRFLRNFGPEIPPEMARTLMGNVLFAVDGYDDIDVHLFGIPEVCQYYAAIHRVWPCWLYFEAILEDDVTLSMIGACVGKGPKGVFKPKQFFEECVPTFTKLVDRAGIGDVIATQRIREVIAHFNSQIKVEAA